MRWVPLQVDLIAVLGKQHGAALREVDAFGDGIFHQQRSSADQALLGDANGVVQCGVDAKEGVAPDRTVTRNHHVRANETVVFDDRIMSNMIAAPQGDIVADSHKRLDSVIFKNETILADRLLHKDGCSTADITWAGVSPRGTRLESCKKKGLG